jgi:hypothetical protein
MGGQHELHSFLPGRKRSAWHLRIRRLPLLVDRYKHRKLLVCVASDKLLHIAAAPPKCRGFTRSLRKTPLQRFHSINLSIGKFCETFPSPGPLIGMTEESQMPLNNDQPAHAFTQFSEAERRSKVRFPLVMRVCYRTFEQGSPRRGTGWTVNMSRNAVLVSAKHGVYVGKRMELSIEWPSLLHGRVPLRFVAAGEVVRCDASSFAVKLFGHQFRTVKRKVTPMPLLLGIYLTYGGLRPTRIR